MELQAGRERHFTGKRNSTCKGTQLREYMDSSGKSLVLECSVGEGGQGLDFFECQEVRSCDFPLDSRESLNVY